MNRKNGIRAARMGYLLISVLLCLQGIVLIAFPNCSVILLCRLGGGVMALFGAVKIIGYCSRDLYRLAFQFDLAFGMLLMTLGVILIVCTSRMIFECCYSQSTEKYRRRLWNLTTLAGERLL